MLYVLYYTDNAEFIVTTIIGILSLWIGLKTLTRTPKIPQKPIHVATSPLIMAAPNVRKNGLPGTFNRTDQIESNRFNSCSALQRMVLFDDANSTAASVNPADAHTTAKSTL